MPDSDSQRIAPGPKGSLFLKSVINFYCDPIRLFDELHKQYGDIVRLEGMGYCAHLITQPEHIKYVLQDNARNYHIGGLFEETTRVVGRGLTTNSGQTWLKQRRLVQSAFQRQHAAVFGNTIVSEAEKMLRQWHGNIKSGRPLDINAEVLHINLQILGRLLFSVDLKRESSFLKALAIVRKVSIERVRSIVKLPFNLRYELAARELDRFAYKQIAKRRSGDVPPDILSMLMRATPGHGGIGMTDTEVHDEIMTLLFAAYEDVANAVAWTSYLLTQNPSVEKRLRAEIKATIGKNPPNAANLQDIPYLSMLVNEVLRLYPTTWSLLRDAAFNDEIGGFHIPAKSMIVIDLHLTHRLPQYWNNPERFDPEHFLSERSTGRPRFAYFPFGGGPRQCIGNELALMEIKVILIRMMQSYQFELVSKIPIPMKALSSLQPDGGVWVKVKAND